jgi:hypothetical protein
VDTRNKRPVGEYEVENCPSTNDYFSTSDCLAEQTSKKYLLWWQEVGVCKLFEKCWVRGKEDIVDLARCVDS